MQTIKTDQILEQVEKKTWYKSLLAELIVAPFILMLVFLPFQTELTSNRLFILYAYNFGLWTILSLGNSWVTEKTEVFGTWLEQPAKRFIIVFVGMLGYTILSAFLFNLVFYKVFFGMDFSYTMEQQGTAIVSIIIITIIIGLFMHGKSFFEAWKQTTIEKEALKRANLVSQYEALKNQVNPHFLFNSLNVLSNLVYKDQDLAANFIQQLSKVYRYVLDTKENEVVSLSTELNALRSYIFLLKIRFGENLNVNVDLPEDESIMIVPLGLQMLVENAIKHNIVSKSKPLRIDIYQERDRIIIQNNLQLKQNVMDSSGIGLPNIKARYQYLSKEEIFISEGKKNGYFTVSLPKVSFKK